MEPYEMDEIQDGASGVYDIIGTCPACQRWIVRLDRVDIPETSTYRGLKLETPPDTCRCENDPRYPVID